MTSDADGPGGPGKPDGPGGSGESESPRDSDDLVFRALASPVRRRILDLLRDGPETTGDLAAAVPDLSRFAVMQHLDVLTDAGLVLVRREGRYRFNYLNAVPIRRTYERWVNHLQGDAASEATGLWRAVHRTRTQGEGEMSDERDQWRVVRIENELRFRATPERVFEALTERTQEWFPASYGGERTKAVVMEPRVGGSVYEDWGDGAGYKYGDVTLWDPPLAASTRTRLHPGTVMDTSYKLEADGDETVFTLSRVVVGTITDEQAEGISTYGDIRNFEDALREVIEG